MYGGSGASDWCCLHLHGTEAGVSSEGEASKATEVKVVAVGSDEVIFEGTGKLVTAERRAKESIGRVESLGAKDINNLGLELIVGESTWEGALDHGIEFSVNSLARVGQLCLDFVENGR